MTIRTTLHMSAALALALTTLTGCPEDEPQPTAPDTPVSAETSQDATSGDATADAPAPDATPDVPAATDTADAAPDTAVTDTDADSAQADADATSTPDALADGETSAGDVAGDVGPPCTSDADCTAPNECVTATCNLGIGACEFANAADGTACTNPDPDCIETAECTAGECVTKKFPADCGDAVCGLDACNNSCGICPVGDLCNFANGQCVDPAAGCMGIDFLGCCAGDGQSVFFCLEGQLVEETCGPGTTCGYGQFTLFECTAEPIDVPADKEYLCPGETCTTSCGDPGVECGYACGQTCTPCPSGTYCTDDQACKACGCAAEWECGQDPCGNDCGTCPSGSVCQADQTCSAVADPAPDASSGDASTDATADPDIGPEAD